MNLEKYLNKNARNFFKNSQKKINELKKKIQELSKREEKIESDVHLKKEEKGNKQEIKVYLSVESVVKSTIAILLILGLAYLLQIMKEIIIIFFFALFLSAAFNPAVDKLEKYKIPRWLGIIIMYIVVLGALVVMFTSLIPIIADQVSSLAISIRDMILNLVNTQNTDSWFMSKIQPFVNQVWESVDQKEILAQITNTLKDLGSTLGNVAGNAIGAIFAVFNGLLNTILVLIITFFMVVDSKNTSNFFHSLFPSRYSRYITEKTKQISQRIGEWVRGQIMLALLMGLISFIVFSILGLHYALTLSFVSALAEFVPYLGPFITFLSASLIALNQDPALMLWLIPVYAILQFLEGNILVPLIVGRSVGLNPIIVLFSLLAGATIGVKLGGSVALGLVGMIISVPIANIISIFVEEYTEKNK